MTLMEDIFEDSLQNTSMGSSFRMKLSVNQGKLAPIEVTFNGNGGTPSYASRTYQYGDTYSELPGANKTGYELLGWYDSLSGGNRILSSDLVNPDISTLYAHWSIGNYDLVVKPNGGTWENPETQQDVIGDQTFSLQYQDTLAIKKPTRTGLGKASYTCVSGIEFKIDPLPPGSGLVFESLIPTGTLLKKYQNQARRQTFEYFKQGMHGWEVIDAKVSLLDGKFDSMGSKPKHFNIIIPLALYRALRDSKVQIMEPVSRYVIEAHKTVLKPISNLLSLYHSQPTIKDLENDEIALTGDIRSTKLLELPIQLRKITSGRGRLSSEFSKYVPSLTQSEESKFFGPDPRNEVPFVITEMGSSLDELDVPLAKKQMSGAKFQWKKAEREARK